MTMPSHASTNLMSFERQHPRERFYYHTIPTAPPGESWPTYHVLVFDRSISTTRPVYEYDRDYEMLDTFEPFRLFVDNHWHYYALISSDYLSFEVLDLETYHVCARIEHPRIGEQAAVEINRLLRRVKPALVVQAGDEQRAGTFMPVAFDVPDVLDVLDEDELVEEFVEDFITRRTHGFVVSGSVWEEKDSLATRKVHLTGIPNGRVCMSEPIPPQSAVI